MDVRPEATDREQTVEITLEPKEIFGNGNIGTLPRRVPADRVVSTGHVQRDPQACRQPPLGRPTQEQIHLFVHAVDSLVAACEMGLPDQCRSHGAN